ncbi:MAG: TetR/AcrR family transcriptional regulator [Spirochaetales bacterium]|nr:MAG: TetR/AcrR family transcriptional regulator [Spirochaetales bacterium]
MAHTNKKSVVYEPMNFPKLKEIERDNRKSLIINAAERVFTQLAFDKVTMRHIAKEAGITATAIYRYFTDKQCLYAEAYIRSNNRLLVRIMEDMNASKDFRLEEITMIIIDHFAREEQNLKMRTHFMIDDTLNNEVLSSINESFRVFLIEIVNYFTRFNPDGDVRLLARMYIASLNGLLITLRKYPGKNREEIIKQMRTGGSLLASMFKMQILRNR